VDETSGDERQRQQRARWFSWIGNYRGRNSNNGSSSGNTSRAGGDTAGNGDGDGGLQEPLLLQNSNPLLSDDEEGTVSDENSELQEAFV